MKLPHPLRDARERRAERARLIAAATARSHMADRTAFYDWEAEHERRRRGAAQ